MAESLAIDGGTPVRTAAWPPLIPGGATYGEEEKQAAIEVIEARSPFRYYGVEPLGKSRQVRSGLCPVRRHALRPGHP